LSKVVVTTDTPGFTAVIKDGSAPTGSFAAVSTSKVVGRSTTYSITGGKARYYLVWITSLGQNESVHVNEITARGS
jgi:hypothetical protein